jgi:transposase
MLERMPDLRTDTKIVDMESLVPQDHLLRKVDKVVDFTRIYDMVEHLYCEDNGRPAADPVILVKMALIQHLFGIPSMRRTVSEVEVNVAYRWFLHFNIDTAIPHFATVSYAFATRFPSSIFEGIFSWILEEAVQKGFVKPQTVFIDATHVKASANKQKRRKELAIKTARVFDEQLREEINAERKDKGKKPFGDDSGSGSSETHEVTVSTTDPDCGLFRKGEHKVEFAYTAHVACDENNFILDCAVKAGNVHDSIVFDEVYDKVTERFEEVETVAADAAYKTPWICKKVQGDGRNLSSSYKRPMTKNGFFRKYDYVYDEYYDCIICPANQILSYSTTNREGYREYKSKASICQNCPHLLQCTHSKGCQKTVLRHIWERFVEIAEDFRHSIEGKISYTKRSETIERVFADAKEKHGMRYTHLRGLERVTNSIRLIFAAMNLKKMAMWA